MTLTKNGYTDVVFITNDKCPIAIDLCKYRPILGISPTEKCTFDFFWSVSLSNRNFQSSLMRSCRLSCMLRDGEIHRPG